MRSRCLASRLRFAFIAALAASLSACVSDRYRVLPPGEAPPVPHTIVLREQPSISTMHFPQGVYHLEAEDRWGYYYRAPGQVMKHAFAGFQPYNGGLYVRKAPPTRVRGYVVWAGGRAKIGNLTRADLEFREE